MHTDILTWFTAKTIQKITKMAENKAVKVDQTTDTWCGIQIQALIKQPARLLLHALLATNCSFSLVDNPVMRTWLGKIAPGFSAPNRRTLVNTFRNLAIHYCYLGPLMLGTHRKGCILPVWRDKQVYYCFQVLSEGWKEIRFGLFIGTETSQLSYTSEIAHILYILHLMRRSSLAFQTNKTQVKILIQV